MIRFRNIAFLSIICIALVACTITIGPPCTPCATIQPTATPTYPPATATPVSILWDSKLDSIGVTVKRVDGARYKLIAAWVTQNGSWDVPDWAHQWQLDTLGGDHHVFGRCLDASGNVLNKTFVMQNGGVASRTPEADGWANLPMAGQNWNPANGQGPYIWYPLNGDVLVGLGMPLNNHWSFFGVWKDTKPSLIDIIVGFFFAR